MYPCDRLYFVNSSAKRDWFEAAAVAAGDGLLAATGVTGVAFAFGGHLIEETSECVALEPPGGPYASGLEDLELDPEPGGRIARGLEEAVGSFLLILGVGCEHMKFFAFEVTPAKRAIQTRPFRADDTCGVDVVLGVVVSLGYSSAGAFAIGTR